MPGDSKQRQSSPDEDNENNQPNTTEQSSDDDSKKNLKKPDEKKHNSGAADLEKVTDFAEEKEINSSSTELTDAIANIRKLSHRKMYLVLVKLSVHTLISCLLTILLFHQEPNKQQQRLKNWLEKKNWQKYQLKMKMLI